MKRENWTKLTMLKVPVGTETLIWLNIIGLMGGS